VRLDAVFDRREPIPGVAEQLGEKRRKIVLANMGKPFNTPRWKRFYESPAIVLIPTQV
jgi:hypothetical protein